MIFIDTITSPSLFQVSERAFQKVYLIFGK